MNKIIFGLGNPGKEYERTRHNLGLNVVRAWGLQTEVRSNVKIVAPTQQMNVSGNVLQDALKFTDIEMNNILIAHDDIELPLGEVQLVLGGSAKGHNGIRSIYDVLGTQDIQRLRLGIGRPPEGMEVKDFVLGKFTTTELSELEAQQESANTLINDFVN
jgi:peptidyl-tRNA hydrolase, PTH1 family